MTTPRLSVVVPTFRRPYSFLRAARSVFGQRGHGCRVELVCIDNDPDGTALPLFKTLAAEAPMPFLCGHAPEPGVANARNAALKLARGDLVAFLDDDEEAPPQWLAALVRVQRDTGAHATFGPVEAALPPEIVRHRRYFEALASRRRPGPSGVIPTFYGMGNSLLVRRALLDGPAPFDPAANETGGEDDALFSAAARRGAVFAWAADAVVREHVPHERATLAYALRRAFAYGQGPCTIAWEREPRDWAGLARHMSVGAAQLAAFAPLAAGAWLLGLEQRASLTGAAAAALGKLVWWRAQRFYGRSALPAAAPQRAPARPQEARLAAGRSASV